jgi:hypothetical protein
MGRISRTALVIATAVIAGMCAVGISPLHAQNFGWGFQRKHISLVRKLPPTGHIDGNSFSVNVTGAGSDVTSDLEAQITSLLVKNDGRLRSISDPKEHPDAVIKARVTSYQPPQPLVKTEQGLELGKKGGPLQNQQVREWTGLLTVSFEAQDVRGNKGIAADTVTSKFDREYAVQTPTNAKPTFGGIVTSHIPKVPLVGSTGGAAGGEDREPNAIEVRDRLIKDVALQIASRLVNTQEDVTVFLARGNGLDDADTLLENKQYTRALESLDTMPPLGKADDDAYRLYDLGVANEALGYQAEDVLKARKYLQEASIDYGKAIDAKPAEKMFLEPQNRIDTALAHYKVLSDRALNQQANLKAVAAAPVVDVLTNADVISMVQAKLDQANIIDTIQHSSAKFDLSAKGQVDLAKAGVGGPIITAMKTKARGQ